MLKDTERITEYAVHHTSPEDELLLQLNRQTHLTTVYPRMLSGPLQGKLLEMISRMIQPARILEIGTFTGYSAICLAKGMAKGGILHTIDINDEILVTALRYIKLAGMENAIVLHHGDARRIIPELNEVFDLVFIDGDKEQYMEYYNQILPKVRSGGFMLIDNVLWSGKVLPDCNDRDGETISIREFNEYVLQDVRVDKLMLPFRDGIYILRKITDQK